jgi:hypothetical protein
MCGDVGFLRTVLEQIRHLAGDADLWEQLRAWW